MPIIRHSLLKNTQYTLLAYNFIAPYVNFVFLKTYGACAVNFHHISIKMFCDCDGSLSLHAFLRPSKTVDQAN